MSSTQFYGCSVGAEVNLASLWAPWWVVEALTLPGAEMYYCGCFWSQCHLSPHFNWFSKLVAWSVHSLVQALQDVIDAQSLF